jgi:predicted phage terminase large subunit-like protein
MTIEIKPHPGPQTDFLSCNADICVYGGQVGGGKTFGMLLEGLRHKDNGKANAIWFRRTREQIKQGGGAWDESLDLYPKFGGVPNLSELVWKFPSRYYLKMTHLEYENTVYQYDGAQIPIALFDELRSFTEKQFFYILTRMRSTSGIKPYVRAGTNPDPTGWLRDIVDWWIGEDGHAIPERSGIVRWFVRLDDKIYWANTRRQLISDMIDLNYPERVIRPKSFTFINASLSDNPTLVAMNPDYEASVLAQHKVERDRLLGNWNSIGGEGDYFDRSMFEEIFPFELPIDRQQVRFWDRAGTEKTELNDPDATASVKMSRKGGTLFVEDFSDLIFEKPGKVLQRIKNQASQDGQEVTVGASQDPGQAGVDQIERFVAELAGYNIFTFVEANIGGKEIRAGAVSAQAEFGNIKIVKGPWNDAFYKYLEYFPKGRYKDPVDAFCGGFYFLTGQNRLDKLETQPDEIRQNAITTENALKLW